ncbi:MAG: hypothetical protein CMO55_11100 [Verrucomicrobiales bacterium]|nr:hypothetical protein [Verrucomicrobiales bacterium]
MLSPLPVSLREVLEAAGLPVPAGDRVPFELEEVEGSIGGRFAKVARAVPDRVAISYAGEEVSYGDLREMVVGFSGCLAGEADVPVALYGNTSVCMVAAIFACFEVGRPYVFLHPSLSAERTGEILRDTGADVVAYDAGGRKPPFELPAGVTGVGLDRREIYKGGGAGNDVGADSLAYIVYTSGSTGQPRGVAQSHRNVLADIQRQSRDLLVSMEDRYGLLFPLGSSAAICHLCGALLNGATLCPLDLSRASFHDLRQWLEKEAVTILDINVSTFREFVRVLEKGENFPALRVLSPGSEPVHRIDLELYGAYFSDRCVLQNAYGTSETRTATQYYHHKSLDPVLDGEQLTIGFPVEGKVISIVDEMGEPVPAGDVGEMVIRSGYIAGGYWNRPRESEERFQREASEIVYRTRDLVKQLESGHLVHVGRSDSSAKVRGHLVDLSSVEHVLRRHSGVEDAAVLMAKSRAAMDCLAAFVIPVSDAVPSPGELREHLLGHLPQSAVPSVFRFLDRFPFLLNQKLDRKALEEMVRMPPVELHRTDATPPESKWEKEIADHWRRVLDLDFVGVHEDFVLLGGDSLRALALFAAIESACGVRFAAADVFSAFTVASMAKKAEALAQGISDEALAVSKFLVPLGGREGEDSLLFVPGGWGGDPEILVFAGIARQLSSAFQMFAVPSRAMDGEWVKVLEDCDYDIQTHVKGIFESIEGLSHVSLVGECVAAVTALFLADLLEKSGRKPGRLILIDPWIPDSVFDSDEDASSDMPEEIRRYYRMLKSAELPMVESSFAIISSTASGSREEVAKFWATRTRGMVELFEAEGDHESILRSEAVKTAGLLDAILAAGVECC